MSLPKTIAEYLEQLRSELSKADPALLQDALYDAEEYLRSELAAHPREGEEALLARIASSYGRPAEVADIYRDTEITVTRAMRPPLPKKTETSSTWLSVFSVLADPRAYASLFYMLLSLVTGIFYFTWAVTGISLSFGLSLLIVGIPFVILFLATVRVLSLVEGRLVETMLGERMPRRPSYVSREGGWLARIGRLFSDPRTWGTLFYQLIMLPLGIIYFTIAVSLLSVGVTLLASPLLGFIDRVNVEGATVMLPGVWAFSDGTGFAAWPALVLLGLLGFAILIGTLHLARGIGWLHAQIAKQLLVKWGE